MAGSTRVASVAFVVCSWSFVQAEASTFVYAAVASEACLPTACPTPTVFVIDAETLQVVTRLPLPANTTPADIVISPDGAHVYVSNTAPASGGSPTLTVIDARRHVVEGSYPIPQAAWKLAVRRDDSRVFILCYGAGAMRVDVFSVSSRSVVGPPLVDESAPWPAGIVASSTFDRFYVFASEPGLMASQIVMYDADTFVELGRTGLGYRHPVSLGISPDGHRLYPHLSSPSSGPYLGPRLGSLDAETLAETTPARSINGFSQGRPLEVARRQVFLFVREAILPAGSSVPDEQAGIQRLGIDGSSGSSTLPLPGRGVSMTVPAGEVRVFVTTTAAADGQAQGLFAVDLDSGTTTQLLAFGGPLASTPAGAQVCNYRLDRRYASWSLTGGSGTVRLTTACAWLASSDSSWARVSTTNGQGNATFTIDVDPSDLPTPRTATVTIGGQLVTVTQAGWLTQPPFGIFETPQDGAAVSGSVAVTGWALDDVGVARVAIYRDPVAGETDNLVYLGDATFVEGARPDVQAYLPDAPFAPRAGWGLMLLTNMLPNGGNGMFRLHAMAQDLEGNQSLLGTHTLLVDNASAGLPFGAVDTPGQGETVSGTIVNWGWALTPGSGFIIPTDGSTIEVLIDGVVVGRPRYGLFRADIAALFPGYTNTDTAVGYFTIDTTTLGNGMHSIAWVVRDSAGRAAGIGSRYFHVFNP